MFCDGLTRASRNWINDRNAEANAVIERSAKAAGVIFVPLRESLNGHERCAPGDAVEYLNGLSNIDELIPGSPQIYIAHSYHPNIDGQAAFYQAFLGALGG